jgi:hypothetical protein
MLASEAFSLSPKSMLCAIHGCRLRLPCCYRYQCGQRIGLSSDLILARLAPGGYPEISRVHLLEPTSILWTRKFAWIRPVYADRHIFASQRQGTGLRLAAKP